MFTDKEDIRPDKILEKRLLLLVLMLTLTILSIGFLFADPSFLRPIILAIFIFIILSIYITITILQSGETAILYGGLANEILKNKKICYIITDQNQNVILQNELAKELLNNMPILKFLRNNLVNDEPNLQKIKELEYSSQNLKETTQELALKFDNKMLFSGYEWFRIKLRPIILNDTAIEDLNQASIFDKKYNIYKLWSFENITSEKTLDSIFKDERRSYYNFLNFLPVGIFVLNKSNNVEYINKTLSIMLGRSKEDVLGKNINEFLLKSSQEQEKLPLGGFQYTAYIKLGTKINEYLVKTDYFKEGEDIQTRGIVIGEIPTNINLKQNYQEIVSQSNSIFNLSPFGMMLLDKDLTIKRVNQQFTDILGVPSPSQLQNNYLNNYLDEDSISKIKKQINSFMSDKDKPQVAYFDLNLKTKNQNKILRLYISPLFSSPLQIKENIKGAILFCLDTTEQKNLETQFAQAQKMQAMGQLAGGIAHDFNNLLTAMIGFSDLLLQRHNPKDPSHADIIQIKQNANCAAELVRQLLQFSRKQPLKPELNSITEILLNYTPLLKRTVGDQIELIFKHGENLNPIKVDQVQLLQVVLNLCVNAKDAMNRKGKLIIQTQMEKLLEPYHFGAETIDAGSFVRLDVTDTGCGIPLENLSRIFEPFFSTKQNIVGSGTGLGLATVYGIVRQMEGFIKVSSTVDVGTTFSIYLPAHSTKELQFKNPKQTLSKTLNDKKGRAVLTPTPKKDSDKIILGLNLSATDNLNLTPKNIENIRILLVDDEDSVRTFAQKALRKKGYTVVSANSAENALETLKTDKNFQLLITDMVMPGLNGIELSKLILEQIPDIKIILASGYSEDILKGEFANIENMSFIPKPFSLSDLTQKVYEALEE
ncbi:MAG: response regulator [Alphaproteobacteria bacterium]|nr:response regulator [Alphaproteobacteria bacterium]